MGTAPTRPRTERTSRLTRPALAPAPGRRRRTLPRCRAPRGERGFAAKNGLARGMVLRASASPLPAAWATADAACGRLPLPPAPWKTPACPTPRTCSSPSRSNSPRTGRLYRPGSLRRMAAALLRRRRPGAPDLRLGRSPAAGCLGRRRRARPPAAGLGGRDPPFPRGPAPSTRPPPPSGPRHGAGGRRGTRLHLCPAAP